MKQNFQTPFFLVVTLTLFGACRQYAHIHGNVGNLPDGMVYLMRYDGQIETVDSACAKGGRFTMRQPGPLPDIYLLRLDEKLLLPVAVEGSEVYVTGDFDLGDMIRVAGSPGNEALEEFLSAVRPYEILLRALRMELQEMSHNTPDSLLYRSLVMKQDSIRRLACDVRSEFVRSYPGNLVSAFLVASALADSTATVDEINALADELDPNMMLSMPLKKVHEWQEMHP